MVDSFTSREDIVNRALQICRTRRVNTFTESSKQAQETAFAYDKLRLAELRRNVWTFACRRTRLWPVSTSSLAFTPPAWAAGTTYKVADIVSYGGNIWTAKQAGINHAPGADITGLLYWDVFFGQLMVQKWNLPINPPTVNSTNRSYDAGELVYMITGPGTYAVYQSLVMNNTNEPDTVDAWNSPTVPAGLTPIIPIMYMTGDVVSYGGVNYQSIVDFNYNNTPSSSPTYWTITITNPTVSASWRQITSAVLSKLIINWPLNSGPVENVGLPNAFMLPNGFCREAPQSPGAGRAPGYLGFPNSPPSTDWERTANFIVSATTNTIEYRFEADVQDVTTFDAMFCEGLAAKIALAVASVLVSDEDRRAVVADAARTYALAMVEARIANGIEQGPIEPPLDNYIACRF